MKISREYLTDSLLDAITELSADHAKEVDDVYGIAPDIDRVTLMALQEAELLYFFVCRVDGKMVGYLMFIVAPDVFWQSITVANQVGFYVVPGHRGVGMKMNTLAEQVMKAKGVRFASHVTTIKNDVGKIYERMGYQMVEKKYIKRL